MDAIKEFLSTISHEIRTPLTSIKGFSKTMLDSWDNLSDEQKKKFINIIYEQSKRLSNLVENAIFVADSSNKYNSSVLKKADINLILNKSIDIVKINYKDKIYKTDLTKFPLYSMLDTDNLQQIFVNLLDNASKYSLNSNVIEIKTNYFSDKNIISIKNFGIHIDNNNKEKIFEKFYRANSYLTSKTQGSGLGLYIVKTLVNKMNGEITVKSEEKPIIYSEFIVSFPIFTDEKFAQERRLNV